jgi:hypothetical protein
VAISLLLPVVSTIAPVLLDSAISSMPRMRDWRFSSVVSSGRPANWGASMSAKVHGRLDGDLVVAHADAAHHLAGIVQAHLGGVGRRHHHRAHLVGAQRIDGDGQRERRIDAAGQADQRAGKPFLPR